MNFENKTVNILKIEHLKDGVKPIVGGIYDKDNLDDETRGFLDNFINKSDTELIDWDFTESEARKNGINKIENRSYIISPCDFKNKYSIEFLNCIGLIVSGIDKNTGKNISFLSHQNPKILDNNESRAKFKKDLNESFDLIINNCIPNTIDVVVFGGNKQDPATFPEDDYKPWIHGVDNIDSIVKEPYYDYINLIKFLNHIVFEKVGFSPVVMSGPNDNFKTNKHSLNIYFDNENRRLYMLRPKQEDSKKNEAFSASDVENQIKKF